MKNLLILLAATCLLTTCATPVNMQQSPENIKELIDSQNFVFVPTTVSPQSGRSRMLNGYFDLTVKKDSILSNLPYFGRAFAPPVNPTQGGIQFVSTDFTLTSDSGDERWNIQIIPKDVTDVQQMLLTIFTTGSASLQVISVNRQPISFQGNVNTIVKN